MDSAVAPVPPSRPRRLAFALVILVLLAVSAALAVFLITRGSAQRSTAGSRQGSSPGWTLVSTPSPGTQSALHSVACVSPQWCVAVGVSNTLDDPYAQQALVETWNGLSWSATPIPGRASSSDLHSVACVSRGSCMAVGWLSPSSNGPKHALAEQWDGSSWSALAVPNSGATTTLESVACQALDFCVAAGSSVANAAGLPTALVESWNGRWWSAVAPPSAPSSVESQLSSVACASPTFCTAVGTYSLSGDIEDTENRTLVESWDGHAWSVVPSPNPGVAFNELVAVACTSVIACVAVGNYSPNSDPYTPYFVSLVETWNGAGWSLEPVATAGASVLSGLRGITCTSLGRCIAVGSSRAGLSTGERSYAQWWNGTTWSAPPIPAIDGALESVVCTSRASCVIVGRQVTAASPAGRTLALLWRPAT